MSVSQLLEPEEGRFDCSIVERLVDGARRYGLGLVPLWFGAFKNGMSTYAPAWVRFDHGRFPRAESEPGRSTLTLSPLAVSTRHADAKAYSSLLCELRRLDPEGRVVRMIQVENEVGLHFFPRDRSPAAEAAFAAAVPAALLTWLDARRGRLHPWLEQMLTPPAERGVGDWITVFGDGADEIFMAWHFAGFVEAVAVAGRGEWDLPCFANAWLLQYPGEPAGEHPTGAPMTHVRDVWLAAAPSLGALAPDIYLDDFVGVCRDYSGWQPLLIPELRRDQIAARMWYACGEHGARLVAPFAYEQFWPAGSLAGAALGAEAQQLAQTCALLRSMLPVIGSRYGGHQVRGLFQIDNLSRKFDLDGIRFQVEWHAPFSAPSTPGAVGLGTGGLGAGGLVAALGDGRFLIGGFGFSLRTHSQVPGRSIEIGALWDGTCEHGVFVPCQRLNGDEHHLRLANAPGLRLVELREIR